MEPCVLPPTKSLGLRMQRAWLHTGLRNLVEALFLVRFQFGVLARENSASSSL
jgi:hypothetical protein